jgi:3'5'-cyclic nucleotide phosphodiesterase
MVCGNTTVPLMRIVCHAGSCAMLCKIKRRKNHALCVCVFCVCREFRSLVIDVVLATDMSYHFQQIKNMKSHLSTPDRYYIDIPEHIILKLFLESYSNNRTAIPIKCPRITDLQTAIV